MGNRGTVGEVCRILLVEDEPSFSSSVVQLLSVHHEVLVAASLAEAREKLKTRSFDVVLLDKGLPDGNGISLIAEIKSEWPRTVVIVLTGDRDFNAVRRAIANGADDYVMKTGSIVAELLVRIPVVVSRTARERNLGDLEDLVKKVFRHEFVGKSLQATTVREQILRLRGSETAILITGESGTGKELASRRLHAVEEDRRRPFIAVNCGAIPTNLFESEFFGHRRGSFTGASDHRIGKFELADGGDIFLDEVGEIPLQDQAKLLRVIQEREFSPVGDSAIRKVNCRIIAATNQNLEQMVREKKFREDLYHRLAVHQIRLPSLRDRKDDIQDLAEFFLVQLGAQGLKVSARAIRVMNHYDWPGNIRELRNALERGVIGARFKKTESIEPEDLAIEARLESPDSVSRRLSDLLPDSLSQVSAKHYQDFLTAADKEYLKLAFKLSGTKATVLQDALGIARSTVFSKLSAHGVLGRESSTSAVLKTEGFQGSYS